MAAVCALHPIPMHGAHHRSDLFSIALSLNFQANRANLPPLAAQMGFQGGQQLAQFGSGSVALDKQAPGRTVNGSGTQTRPERRGNQRFDGIQACA